MRCQVFLQQPHKQSNYFTRNSILGASVILSLGNRAAWGTNVPDECLSVPTWGSYVDGGYNFASFDPNKPSQVIKRDKADAILNAGLPPIEDNGYVCPND